MKALLILSALLGGIFLFGCSQEEPAAPLSPEAQEALKTGRTGPPPEAKGTEPGR